MLQEQISAHQWNKESAINDSLKITKWKLGMSSSV